MININNLTTQPVHKFSLTTLIVAGAALGLAVISLFVFPVINHPKPGWPTYWMIRPLMVTPLFGAATGVWYYLMDNFRYRGGWKTAFAYVSSIAGVIIGLWLGIIAGLAGTMWH